MVERPPHFGRVLRSGTTSFSVGCRQLIADQQQLIPALGALVRTAGNPAGRSIFGLIYNVTIEDDNFVRQLVAAGVDRLDLIEDQRQRRQVPIIVDVLVVGHQYEAELTHRLPPQPPATLADVRACSDGEVVTFTHRHDWLRTVLVAGDAPIDHLLPATLRRAAEARPAGEREEYLLAACRELARLLTLDLPRLDGILRLLR